MERSDRGRYIVPYRCQLSQDLCPWEQKPRIERLRRLESCESVTVSSGTRRAKSRGGFLKGFGRL